MANRLSRSNSMEEDETCVGILQQIGYALICAETENYVS